LQALVNAVRDLAKGNDNGLGFLRSLFPGSINNYAFQTIKDAQLFGVVIAVKSENRQEAESIIDQGFGTTYCGGRCFAIIIVVNDDKTITDIVLKGNINPEIAREILAQMGIVQGNKLPDAPRVRFLIMLLMMALGMVQ
jgi:hypothetical protein